MLRQLGGGCGQNVPFIVMHSSGNLVVLFAIARKIWPPGVDFTKVLSAAFRHADP